MAYQKEYTPGVMSNYDVNVIGIHPKANNVNVVFEYSTINPTTQRPEFQKLDLSISMNTLMRKLDPNANWTPPANFNFSDPSTWDILTLSDIPTIEDTITEYEWACTFKGSNQGLFMEIKECVFTLAQLKGLIPPISHGWVIV